MTFCSHCGLPIVGEGIPGDAPASGASSGARYCCYGCRMVAEILGTASEASTSDAMPFAAGPRALRYRLFVGALLTGFVMVLSLAISTGYGFGALRQLRSDTDAAHWVLLAATMPVLLLLGVPVARGAAADLRRGRLTLSVLFVLGTSSAVGVSLFSYARGSGPVYLETASMLLVLYTLGRYLEARAKEETTRVLGRLLDVPPVAYERLTPHPGEVYEEALRAGDRLRIRVGDVFPVDGLVEDGRGFVDQSSLTGEARPVLKCTGDAVYAGTANLDGVLTIRATAVAEDRRLARIEQMTREALERPPRLASLTERIMRGLIPTVVVLALLTFGVWFYVAGYEKALYAALSVVLIACPCALGLAVPLTLVVAHGEAARQGLLIRSGQALLDLSRVRAFVFDKTGTLSAMQEQTLQVVLPETVPAVSGSHEAPGADRLLRYAASLEAHVTHPLAEAVRSEARRRALDLLPAEDVGLVPGVGVAGYVQDGTLRKHVALGGAALTRPLHAARDAALRQAAATAEADGHTVLYLLVDDEPAALFTLQEQVKPHAAQAVRDLQALGLYVCVLTGDQPQAGRRLSARLEIPVRSGTTPEEKARLLARLRRAHGPVAMVGDGLNDAAALAEADVGLALTTGAATTVEAADIALYNPDLRRVAWLKQLADRTGHVVRQNLAWTFAYNGVGLVLAMGGLLHPLVAVAVMAGSSVVVTRNALRIREGRAALRR